MGACALQPMRKSKSGDQTGQRVNWNSNETSGSGENGSKDGGLDITEVKNIDANTLDSTLKRHEAIQTNSRNSIVQQGPVTVSDMTYKENIPESFPATSNFGITKLVNPGYQTESNGTSIVEGSNPAEHFDPLAAGYESTTSRSFYQNKVTRAIDTVSQNLPNGACINYQEEPMHSSYGYQEKDPENIPCEGAGNDVGFGTSTVSTFGYEAVTEPSGRPVYDDVIGEFVYVLEDDAPIGGLEIITPHEINSTRVNGSCEATTSKEEPMLIHAVDYSAICTK